MFFIRLGDDAIRDIDLAIGEAALLDDGLVFLVHLEDALELLPGDGGVFVDDQGGEADDAAALGIDEKRECVLIVLIQLLSELFDAGVVLLEPTIDGFCPLLDRPSHLIERERDVMKHFTLLTFAREALTQLDKLRNGFAFELEKLADELHDKERGNNDKTDLGG